MPFQSAPNCASAAILGTYHGKEIAHVLNFVCLTTYGQGDIDNLAAFVDAQVGTDYLGNVNNSVQYAETHVRGLSNIIDLESVNNANAGNGTSGAVEMPANSSAVVTLRTGFTGRSARGRFYAWPASAAQTVTGQQFSAGYLANLVLFLDHIRINSPAHNWDFVVLSRHTGGALRPSATHKLITIVEARNTDMDSQRGRLLRGH